MATYTIQDTTLTNIANAVREKTETTDTMKPTDMPDLIRAIVSGGAGGGLNTDEYNITVLTDMAKTQTFFTNWKDYCSSLDDIELFLFKIQQPGCYFYVKGFCPKYNDTHVGVYQMYAGTYSTIKVMRPATAYADDDATWVRIDDAGFYTRGTVSYKPGVIMVSKKKEA